MKEIVMAFAASSLLVAAGCAKLDRAYNKEVRWTNAAVVHVFTNTVVETNTVAEIVERTNIVWVTHGASGVVSGYATREPETTNFVRRLVTNVVPVFQTSIVAVPVTNLVGKPEAGATIQAAGTVVNNILPGLGSIFALVVGGAYHGYRQARNRKVNEALIQGVETARAILERTPQGEAADAQLVRWLKEQQKEAGVFTTVSTLVENYSDNAAAKLTAQEILERVQRAQPH